MLEPALQDAASAALAAMPEHIREALAAKAGALAVELRARIARKLAGGVLNAKSGALAASISATVEDSAAGVVVRIASRGVKYAAIHEYGGTVPPHQIVPDKARALAFIIGGKKAFAARVNLPAITMPERSYMRAALAEMTDEIRQGFAETAGEIWE